MNRIYFILALASPRLLAAHAEPSAHEHAPAQAPAAAATEPAHEPTAEHASAPPSEHAAATEENHAPAPPENGATKNEEIASMLRIGLSKLEKADFSSAEIAFRQVLAERATRDQDREALIGLARTYRKKGDFTKAAAVYEKYIKEYPDDSLYPQAYLELGRTLRALGSYKAAIGRFYSVINSTLKLPETGAIEYRQLARTAQFEIAETYFQSGDYEQATRFFSRLKLLDLAPEDRARAHFKSAYSQILGNEHEKAISTLRAFLEQNPNDENVPEARYLMANSLRILGRNQEALATTLDLLKAEQSRTQSDPKRWAYWQRKTGNLLANEFYERGDFNSSLKIYQNLNTLSEDPNWTLPVTYQIGLCQERMQMYDRARECYQSIVDNYDSSKTDKTPRPDLVDLSEMAAWRLNQLAWTQKTEAQISQIFPTDPSKPRPSLPLPAAPDSHDINGSAAKPLGSL